MFLRNTVLPGNELISKIVDYRVRLASQKIRTHEMLKLFLVVNLSPIRGIFSYQFRILPGCGLFTTPHCVLCGAGTKTKTFLELEENHLFE